MSHRFVQACGTVHDRFPRVLKIQLISVDDASYFLCETPNSDLGSKSLGCFTSIEVLKAQTSPNTRPPLKSRPVETGDVWSSKSPKADTFPLGLGSAPGSTDAGVGGVGGGVGDGLRKRGRAPGRSCFH